jgi:hypothetical protein
MLKLIHNHKKPQVAKSILTEKKKNTKAEELILLGLKHTEKL